MGLSEILNQVELKERESRRKEQDAIEKLNRASRAREFWEHLHSELRRERYAQVVLMIRSESSSLEAHQALSNDQMMELARGICTLSRSKADVNAKAFVRAFPTAAQQAGLDIDESSRHPTYTFKQGFIRVEVDDRSLAATVRPRDGKPKLIGMDVEAVVDLVASEVTRLFGRKFDATDQERFLKRLHTAYQAVIKHEKRQYGDELPLRRVTNRLSKNQKTFSADEFNVNLAELLSTGQPAFNGHRLHVSQTRNTSQGMLLHGFEQGGYVGFISFKEDL
jgi:hypothetical protein